MPSLKDVSVHAGACATYDPTREAAEHLGLPATACHPQDLTHHLGLYFMAARGAEIAGEVVLPASRTQPGSRRPLTRAPHPEAVGGCQPNRPHAEEAAKPPSRRTPGADAAAP